MTNAVERRNSKLNVLRQNPKIKELSHILKTEAENSAFLFIIIKYVVVSGGKAKKTQKKYEETDYKMT